MIYDLLFSVYFSFFAAPHLFLFFNIVPAVLPKNREHAVVFPSHPGCQGCLGFLFTMFWPSFFLKSIPTKKPLVSKTKGFFRIKLVYRFSEKCALNCFSIPFSTYMILNQ